MRWQKRSPISFIGFRFNLSFVTEILQNSDECYYLQKGDKKLNIEYRINTCNTPINWTYIFCCSTSILFEIFRKENFEKLLQN
jgi:hypothetical protein